jgi:hypothetical protein
MSGGICTSSETIDEKCGGAIAEAELRNKRRPVDIVAVRRTIHGPVIYNQPTRVNGREKPQQGGGTADIFI